jgi:hypothetical protein
MVSLNFARIAGRMRFWKPLVLGLVSLDRKLRVAERTS